jgi:hypothetical protein
MREKDFFGNYVLSLGLPYVKFNLLWILHNILGLSMTVPLNPATCYSQLSMIYEVSTNVVVLFKSVYSSKDT